MSPLDAPIAPAPEGASGGPEMPVRVLVVDDDPAIRRLCAWALEGDGHAVTTVPDGQTALHCAAADHWDLILVDLHMPGLDGRETARRLRASQPLAVRAPVLGFTADDDVAGHRACIEAGMVAVLTKPLAVPELRAAVRHHLGTVPPELDASVGAGPPIPPALRAEFVQDLREHGQQLSASSELAAIRSIAHRVAGSAGIYGLPGVSAVAHALAQITDDGPSPGPLRRRLITAIARACARLESEPCEPPPAP